MKKYFIIILIVFIYGEAYSQSYKDISVKSHRDFSFGNILPGITTSVATTAQTAGRYLINMSHNMTVSLTFNLPVNLSSGGNNLHIDYIATKSTTSNDGTLGTSFDPYTGTTIQRTDEHTSDWYIRIGGSIPTLSTQASGDYTGTIILTMTIIGG